MNYKIHYEKLIERAKTRSIEGYIERHHVIPRCFGGTDKSENIVLLTAREHLLAHLLLHKMQTDKRKRHQMLTAVIMMKGKMINSRLYEKARIDFACAHSALMLTNHPHKGKPMSIKQREMISIHKKELFSNKENHPMFGRKHSDESIQKNRESNSNIINIYNNNDELIYTCKEGLSHFCKIHNLPFKVLKKSYQTNGEYKLYTNYDDKRASPPRNDTWAKFTGWYAKVVYF